MQKGSIEACMQADLQSNSNQHKPMQKASAGYNLKAAAQMGCCSGGASRAMVCPAEPSRCQTSSRFTTNGVLIRVCPHIHVGGWMWARSDGRTSRGAQARLYWSCMSDLVAGPGPGAVMDSMQAQDFGLTADHNFLEHS